MLNDLNLNVMELKKQTINL